MSYICYFLILLTVATGYIAPTIDFNLKDPCKANVDRYSPCTATISAPTGCISTVLNYTDTIFAQCNGVNFFWSQGDNNMTFIIETAYTQTHQAYNISLANSPLIQGDLHVYRVNNGQEIEITTRDDKIFQISDSNYQIILKFQGPTRPVRGGVLIIYSTVAL